MDRKTPKNHIRAAALLLTAALLCACSSRGAEPEETRAPAVTMPPATAAPAAPTETPAPTPETDAPPTATSAPTETPAPTPEPYSPDLKEQEKMEDTFFEESAFVGNSLVDGLRLFGGLEYGSFYAATSVSVVSAMRTRDRLLANGGYGTLIDKLCEAQHDKIYILLGVNEIAFEPDYFAGLYGEMLDKIRESEPEASIYIMGLTPVTKSRSSSSDTFTMKRVTAYNEALRALAEERECYFVDLVDALADDSGYLPAAGSTDGVHLTPDKYVQWSDYLRTHYAPADAPQD